MPSISFIPSANAQEPFVFSKGHYSLPVTINTNSNRSISL
nr:MAG TPA: hypothetical protein [Caudoviricetes sp.]